MTVDTVAADIAAPAEEVFAFMSDPEKLNLWSFGTWETVIHPDGLIEGRALQSGAPIWLRIEAHAPLFLIDYHLGAAPDRLFMNDGDGTFTDRAAAWGLNELHGGCGASVADFNNDGRPDLYVTSFGDATAPDIALSAADRPISSDEWPACFRWYLALSGS